jgi:catalase (peroxidase I)
MKGPWTNMPIGFTNRFFKFLFEREWKKKEWIGPLQFEDSTGKFMMLPTDITLKTDPNFRKWAILYKDDQE